MLNVPGKYLAPSGDAAAVRDDDLFFFLVFLGPHPEHMEVSRLEVESEL